MPLIHSQPTIKGTQNNSGNPRFKTLTNQPTKSQAMKQFTISIQPFSTQKTHKRIHRSNQIAEVRLTQFVFH